MSITLFIFAKVENDVYHPYRYPLGGQGYSVIADIAECGSGVYFRPIIFFPAVKPVGRFCRDIVSTAEIIRWQLAAFIYLDGLYRSAAVRVKRNRNFYYLYPLGRKCRVLVEFVCGTVRGAHYSPRLVFPAVKFIVRFCRDFVSREISGRQRVGLAALYWGLYGLYAAAAVRIKRDGDFFWLAIAATAAARVAAAHEQGANNNEQ